MRDTDRFLFIGTRIICRGKTNPRSKMFYVEKNTHINTGFWNQRCRRKVTNTRQLSCKINIHMVFRSSRNCMWPSDNRVLYDWSSSRWKPLMELRISSLFFFKEPRSKDLIWTSSTSLEVRSSENTAEALTPKGSETTNAKEILETVWQFCTRFFSEDIKFVIL